VSDHADNIEQLSKLAGAVCEEVATCDDFVEMDAILLADQEARDRYLDYCWMHVALKLEMRAQQAAQKVHQNIDRKLPALSTLDSVTNPNIAAAPVPAGLFSTAFHGAIGFFSQELPFSLLIATVVTCLGLLAGSMVYVTHHQELATTATSPKPSALDEMPAKKIVGRITGMVDCSGSGSRIQGADIAKSEIPNSKYLALGDKITLSSGLLEITYDTGATVILQGPVKYEIDSTDGGFLSVGKLTARLEKSVEGREEREKKAVSAQRSVASERNPEISKSPISNPQSLIPNPSFAVRTPTATVTDLGTEFGVEVLPDGGTKSIVFRGKVAIEPRAVKTGSPKRIELVAGESAAVAKSGEMVYARKRPASVTPAQFVRTIEHAKSLIAYWPMDEGRGRGVFDRSGNNINCWFTGDPEWTEGRFGRAVKLLGKDQYLSAVKDSKLDLRTGDFTISLWFKGGSVKNWRWLLCCHRGGSASDPGLVITTYIADGRTNSHLRVSLGTWFTDVYDHLESKDTINEQDKWYHLALTRNETRMAGYLNGKQVFSENVPAVDLASTNDNNGDLLLGACQTTGPYYRGALDDVAIWNQALTARQIQALAKGTVTPLKVLTVETAFQENDNLSTEVQK